MGSADRRSPRRMTLSSVKKRWLPSRTAAPRPARSPEAGSLGAGAARTRSSVSCRCRESTTTLASTLLPDQAGGPGRSRGARTDRRGMSVRLTVAHTLSRVRRRSTVRRCRPPRARCPAPRARRRGRSNSARTGRPRCRTPASAPPRLTIPKAGASPMRGRRRRGCTPISAVTGIQVGETGRRTGAASGAVSGGSAQWLAARPAARAQARQRRQPRRSRGGLRRPPRRSRGGCQQRQGREAQPRRSAAPAEAQPRRSAAAPPAEAGADMGCP